MKKNYWLYLVIILLLSVFYSLFTHFSDELQISSVISMVVRVMLTLFCLHQYRQFHHQDFIQETSNETVIPIEASEEFQDQLKVIADLQKSFDIELLNESVEIKLQMTPATDHSNILVTLKGVAIGYIPPLYIETLKRKLNAKPELIIHEDNGFYHCELKLTTR